MKTSKSKAINFFWMKLLSFDEFDKEVENFCNRGFMSFEFYERLNC